MAVVARNKSSLDPLIYSCTKHALLAVLRLPPCQPSSVCLHVNVPPSAFLPIFLRLSPCQCPSVCLPVNVPPSASQSIFLRLPPCQSLCLFPYITRIATIFYSLFSIQRLPNEGTHQCMTDDSCIYAQCQLYAFSYCILYIISMYVCFLYHFFLIACPVVCPVPFILLTLCVPTIIRRPPNPR